MDIIDTIIGCLTGRTDEAAKLVDEKATVNYTDKDKRSDQDVVRDILNALCNAEKNGRDLERILQDNKILKEGTHVAQAMKEAIEKATIAAVDFAREHPVYCTIIALGVLVILAPWAIEALGFGELGPIEGTFASWWQARYAGYVPKGSLFSFF